MKNNKEEINTNAPDGEVIQIENLNDLHTDSNELHSNSNESDSEIPELQPDCQELPTIMKSDFDSLQQRFDVLNDKYLRLVAEFDNYRRRTSRERLDLVKTAGEEMIQGILPVLDDFGMAQESFTEATDMVAIREGVELIHRKLHKFLESKGLQPIETVGLPLDTDLHEAVSQLPAKEKKQKGKIIDVLQQGYLLNGKVIRYAKVVVGV